MSDDPTNTEPASVPSDAATSPLDRVPAPLRAAIEARGFTELTTVQIAALDAIDQARDLRISSQTGSGKTVALGLAISPELIDSGPGGKSKGSSGKPKGPRAVVIVPTRELASQVRTELEWLYANVREVRIECVTGGTHVGQERRRLASCPRVLVGTPGRLLDHIRSGALNCGEVTELVLDEADQMLDMGFRDELQAIVAEMPAERRTHLLSATFPPAVRGLVEECQTNPLHVEGTRLGLANEDIAHVGHIVQSHDHYAAVVNLLLLADGQRTLIFVATRVDAAALAEKLAGDGFMALPLSGELAQAQRTRTLNAFRSGSAQTLVATDVAARGLDVPDVTLVLHVDLPMDAEVYTHRSGRTGRAGRKGRSVMLVTPRAERRARRILSDARVEVQWQVVPSAIDVQKARLKRQRRRIKRALENEDGTCPVEMHREYAEQLLAEGEPTHIVATLLALAQGAVSEREPMELETPMPSRPTQSNRGAAPFGRNSAPFAGGGGSRDSRDGGHDSRDGGDFNKFTINWGARQGANARRLLALICRRGDVTSKVIGAINVEPYQSTFEVAANAAAAFESRARRPDARHPEHRIERDGSGTRRPPRKRFRERVS